MTRLGAFLRRYRLDEVPQVINVLRGELAIVGPRPEWVSTAERYREVIPFYDQRTLVRPGITGWAQVNLGATSDEAGAMQKLSYDFYYLKHMSPMLDMEILARSIRTILRGDVTPRSRRRS
ncbi:sugar transferase [Phycicoccus endophyticus]|uniref:Sugar transferase n=1 Tax=Phycicoccus endophyticus TaxID=1690220 RepID=A0A7G9R5X2_9MICO|nr:sugar transferase [Phycicoccus endophyticus]